MASACVDSILFDLEKNFDTESDELELLKLDLRFLRTFLLCSRKCQKDVCLEPCDGKHASLRSSLFSLENALQKMKQGLEDGGSSRNSEEVISGYRATIDSFKEEIKELYFTLVDCTLHSGSPVRVELMEIAESLLENLEDLKWANPYCDQAFYMVRTYDKVLQELVEVLERKLSFFRNFICYVNWRGVGNRQLKDLLAHFGVMVVNAARATYTSWFYRKDKTMLILVQLGEISPDNPLVKDDNKLIPELLEKVEVDDPRLLEIYIQVLTASNLSGSSHTRTLETEMHILGNFVDSLLSNLFELLNCSTCSMVSLKDQLQVLYEGLRFLRTILKQQQEKFSELDEEMQDLVGVVVNDAGIAICKFVFAKGKDVALCDLLKNVGSIKLEVEKKYPVTSAQDFLITSEPSFTADFQAKRAAKTLSHVSSQGSITINEVVVGFDDEAKTIINQLMRGSMQLDMVFIVGMPGLGKTTLARKVYNDPTIIGHFHVRAWCHVSQIYDKKNLLLEILDWIVQKAQYSEMDEDGLADRLYKHLKGNKYLIVLDDVWDIEAWEGLKILFPDDAKGSRILFTSRLHNLASQIKLTAKPHSLRRLTDDESYELLQKKIFSKEDYYPALSDLGMQIAKNCSGLPLTIVIVAGILTTIKQHDWEKVAKRLSSNTVYGIKMCMDMLEVSYNHLPDYLKQCFLYFGAFPGGQEIPIWKLACLWMAEGFVKQAESRSLENVAEDYMMDLVDRSLVTVAKQRSLTGVKTCSIHDLLHEFCVAKAKEEHFLQVLQGSEELFTFSESGNTRRLCIHSQVKDFQLSRLYCPRISCLLFFPHGDMSQTCNILFILRICKLLTVLDLEQIDIGITFPSEIEMLVKLRYLAIFGAFESIPSSVANLTELETFRVKTYYGDILLPATIWTMKKLRHLDGLGKCDDLILVEENLKSSPSLENLNSFSTLTLTLGPMTEMIMKKFPNIRKLKCRLIGGFVGESSRVVKMNFLSQLESLKLYLGQYHGEFWFHENLKKLTLEYFSWSIISTVSKLPNLEILKLHTSAFEGVSWDMAEGEFPKLRILKLVHLNVVRWTGDDNIFPFLEKLVLQQCRKLEELPSCLNYISDLETIEVHWCSPLTASFVRDIEEEQRSMGNENLKILIPGEKNSVVDKGESSE